ncbi:MFS general substrate transporter [Tilletiopsis washingtonensis]|uniref:MFS general substrate transporter n=1 Tax=Tilletiopsis washingtonensis TaxID=58919 RepID=A0A316ZIM8_9BASI|nr:MFS general substrate transporter [Tilletiopsis washingtonensis]PWO01390.1 MFS general substrate transporter [Tilletiopsis washingtonensis]
MASVPPPVVHTEQPAFLRAGADDKKLSPVEAETKSAHGSADDGAETEAERNMTVAEYAASQGVDEKKLMRKVDMHLIPWLSVLYLLSFLDRSAIGNARLFGLEASLGMSSREFGIATSVFFFTYAFFEVPSNILLKRMRPSVWFPLLTFFVGVTMLAQGLVHSYGGLVAARVCLGIAEAGLFPGVNYLLSGYYKRGEFGIRAAVFFSAATASGAFGGLLSVALSRMNGIGGYEGWRWIFIIIGLATVVSSIISIWLCEDFPDTAKFLTEPERRVIMRRLRAEQPSVAGEKFTWAAVGKGFVDWKTWVGSLMYIGVDAPLYAFSVFTPTIVRALGYSSINANLLSVPIYVLACIVTVFVGLAANKYKDRRAQLSLGFLCVGIGGYVVLAASRLPGLSYGAIFFAACGIYPLIPNTIALTISSVEGSYKRSVVSGFIISMGNLQGAGSTNAYPRNQAPWYTAGHGVVIMYLGVGLITTLLYYIGVKHENARRERGACDETILDDASAEGVERARVAREEEMAGYGFWKRLLAKYHEQSGGTYATVEEARRLKGDAYSGHRYSL